MVEETSPGLERPLTPREHLDELQRENAELRAQQPSLVAQQINDLEAENAALRAQIVKHPPKPETLTDDELHAALIDGILDKLGHPHNLVELWAVLRSRRVPAAKAAA